MTGRIVLLRRMACALLFALVCASAARAQESTRPPAPAAPKDALGRDTPRGTLLGFMNAARGANDEAAPLYLDTDLRDEAAVVLAHKLFIVLDRRLPPRLHDLSDRPEGSVANPLKPDQDIVGTIATADGPLDVIVERVARSGSTPVWLFSRRTLDAIPHAYDETDLFSLDSFLPLVLRSRIGGIRLFDWLVLCLVLPLTYKLTGVFERVLGPAVFWWRTRRRTPGPLPPMLVPGAVRLFMLAVLIRWMLVTLELPLRERQFWASTSAMLAIAAVAWALLILNGGGERYMVRRSGRSELAAILRLLRRVADLLVLAAVVLVTLQYFGFDPTAALAGLGIGGIAVALAAQKTLENVIGGMSIIFDKALRVGDFVRLGDTVGSVDYIGLRSSRIRTLDRTMLSVPNGQIANVNIETLSARDKFRFLHVVALRHETASAALLAVVNGIRAYLANHPMIDRDAAIRARFFRLGPFSLDIEIFAYVIAADWDDFLDTQQELLLGILAIVERAGVTIALPSQTVHVTDLATQNRALDPGAAHGVPRGASL